LKYLFLPQFYSIFSQFQNILFEVFVFMLKFDHQYAVFEQSAALAFLAVVGEFVCGSIHIRPAAVIVSGIARGLQSLSNQNTEIIDRNTIRAGHIVIEIIPDEAWDSDFFPLLF
jgi:hypothetical protein